MKFFHDFELINPSITGWYVRLRVVRSLVVHLNALSKIVGLVLADEHGVMVDAMIEKEFADYYNKFIDAGDWITIMRFGVYPNLNPVRVTSHKFKICFFKDTVVRKTTAVVANPHYALTYFSSIIDDEIDTSVLIDLVGAIHDVGEVENTRRTQNVVNDLRICFKLKNKINCVLECLASGKQALDFSQNYHSLGGGVIVAVLGWWKLDHYFDGPKNVQI
ncbi:replication protein A1-like [Arabidopsis thaliana]|uniref:Replication protein A1-like n=1 Tax=Arabidopsis thaliana TaxID=3702 RepID=Q9LHP7_ARATH|nr:replication protein A1-like [Arabidopsis thaliana]